MSVERDYVSFIIFSRLKSIKWKQEFKLYMAKMCLVGWLSITKELLTKQALTLTAKSIHKQFSLQFRFLLQRILDLAETEPQIFS